MRKVNVLSIELDEPLDEADYRQVEEWLYVIAGERTLAVDDLVRFPTGPLGAHTVKGPGRFVIFSAGQDREPWMSVFPDSDKVSGPEGILLRSSAVGYFHKRGDVGSQGARRSRARP